MLKRWGVGLCLAGALASSVGCRCLPGLNCYGNVIDDVADAEWWHPLDNVYCPRLDVSRAGRPDWCGPINRTLSHCRCVNGTWDRYDECHLYPPAYPYQYPAEFFGTVVTPANASQSLQPAPPAEVLPQESREVEREMLPDPSALPRPPQQRPPQPLPPPPAPEPNSRRTNDLFQDSGVTPASAQVPAPTPASRSTPKSRGAAAVQPSTPATSQSLLPYTAGRFRRYETEQPPMQIGG